MASKLEKLLGNDPQKIAQFKDNFYKGIGCHIVSDILAYGVGAAYFFTGQPEAAGIVYATGFMMSWVGNGYLGKGGFIVLEEKINEIKPIKEFKLKRRAKRLYNSWKNYPSYKILENSLENA